jgi:hypothetical protein
MSLYIIKIICIIYVKCDPDCGLVLKSYNHVYGLLAQPQNLVDCNSTKYRANFVALFQYSFCITDDYLE